jgi:MoaA/NifB/PqqE/SkfB family radical SAM enzyme
MEQDNITGFRKTLFNVRLKISVLVHFLAMVLKGRIGIRQFFRILKRLNYFLSKIQHNKFFKVTEGTKLDMYLPAYPSKAFLRSCEKVNAFDAQFPCLTVLISVTSACRFNCRHCYQKLDKGSDADIDTLVDVVKKLQDKGVTFFNVEGGEPFLTYDRLKKVCDVIDDRSEIWVNSTGDGMSAERLTELKKAGLNAVMFSLHSPDPDEFNSFLGSDKAWDTLQNGISLCHETGISVALNCCLTRDKFYDTTFEKIMERAKEFNAVVIQLIKPKPAGAWLESGVDDFSADDLKQVKELVAKYNSEPAYREFPAISAQIIEEDRSVFGCTSGGADRFYINAKGDVQPCEFLNISFGNICQEDFEGIYARMRKEFDPPCCDWLCEKYAEKIALLKKEHSINNLPLPPDISKHVYENWQRGENTELYKHLKEM